MQSGGGFVYARVSIYVAESQVQSCILHSTIIEPGIYTTDCSPLLKNTKISHLSRFSAARASKKNGKSSNVESKSPGIHGLVFDEFS